MSKGVLLVLPTRLFFVDPCGIDAESGLETLFALARCSNYSSFLSAIYCINDNNRKYVRTFDSAILLLSRALLYRPA